MKKLNIFLISLLLMAFSSCSKEKEINRLSKADNYGVAFSIEGLSSNATRGTVSPIEGTMAALDREKNINELYAVVYQGGAFYKVEKATFAVNKYSFDMEKAGNFDVYLVANPDEDLITKLNTKANTPGSLKNLLVEQEVGADNKATNFLMTAEPFNVTTQAGQTVTHAAVSLVRLAARVDFYNTVEGLSMTQITFKNRVTNSILIDTKTNNAGLALNSTKTYQTAEGLKANECIGAIYSYENNEKGSVSFTLDATYKGAAIQKEITFDDLPLKRNYLYHVIISEATAGGGEGGGEPTPDPDPNPNTLKVNIVVADWNEAEVLEWKGEKLTGGTPTFTASGTNITATPAQNPSLITIPASTNTITVTAVMDDITHPVVEVAGSTKPSDVTITTGAKSKISGGKFQQIYTITLNAAVYPGLVRVFEFAVVNPLDKDKKREFMIKAERPKMAIEYVAEYNVNTAGDGFTNSHANDQSGYFNWYKATGTTDATYNTTGENIFNAAGLNGYHLPTQAEWLGIIPANINSVHYSHLSSTNDYSESITVNGVTNTYTADYRNKGNGITYALRFKGNGNTQLAAYRYERVGSFVDGNLNSYLKVTVRYLGDGFTGTVANITKESYWNNNDGDDVTRVFPATGWKDESSSLYSLGTYGNCWASTEYSNSKAWFTLYSINYAYLSAYSKDYQRCIRPFSDN